MIGIDTNVLLRFFLHDNDPAQSAQAQFIVRTHAPVFLNDIVLAEFAWTCRKTFKLDWAAVQTRLKGIAESTEFAVRDPQSFAAAIKRYGKARTGFADHFISLSNIAAGCSATLTFDRDAASSVGFEKIQV